MRLRLHKYAIKAVVFAFTIIIISILLLKLVSVWDNASYSEAESNPISEESVLKDTEPTAPDVLVREPNETELGDLSSGILSRENLIQDLVKDAVVKPKDLVDQEQPSQPVKSEYERRMAELIAEAYVLRDEYTMALESMYGEAEATLTTYVNESRSGDEINALISSYLSRASSMEADCDGKIDRIVNEMDALIDTLVETYVNEKATKQAWYISRLSEKGLIVQ